MWTDDFVHVTGPCLTSLSRHWCSEVTWTGVLGGQYLQVKVYHGTARRVWKGSWSSWSYPAPDRRSAPSRTWTVGSRTRARWRRMPAGSWRPHLLHLGNRNLWWETRREERVYRSETCAGALMVIGRRLQECDREISDWGSSKGLFPDWHL